MEESKFFDVGISADRRTRAAQEFLLEILREFKEIPALKEYNYDSFTKFLDKNIVPLIDMLVKYEEILYGAESPYRDHINHQFRVILLEI